MKKYREDKDIDWNRILPILKQSTNRIARIGIYGKTIEQKKQIEKILSQMASLIPEGTVLKDKEKVISFVEILNESEQATLNVDAKHLGFYLLNAIMHIYGVLQSNIATRYLNFVALSLQTRKFGIYEQPRARRLKRFMTNIDFILLSAIEF